MIKLKEELKNISSNKLSRIKKIAKQMRRELEKYHDWKSDKLCFTGKCHNVSQELVDKLKQEGIYAYRVNGLYYGASDEYEPDMSDWTNEERLEYNDATEYGEFNSGYGFNHWWVVAENKWIIDITADQFHPNESEQYRIVITNVGDVNYGA